MTPMHTAAREVLVTLTAIGLIPAFGRGKPIAQVIFQLLIFL
jgi:hypothetical protein